MRVLVLALLTTALCYGGCTPIISDKSRKLVDTDAPFSAIRATPEAYIGKHLLTGGRIASVRNSQNGAELEIVQFELDSCGMPLNTFRSYGRFIASTTEYLEPMLYRLGMQLTLVGEIKGKQTRKLDDMDYTYPVLVMREWHLWQGSEQNSGYQFPPPLPQYNPYNYGYGYEPFLPRPFNPVHLPR